MAPRYIAQAGLGQTIKGIVFRVRQVLTGKHVGFTVRLGRSKGVKRRRATHNPLAVQPGLSVEHHPTRWLAQINGNTDTPYNCN